MKTKSKEIQEPNRRMRNFLCEYNEFYNIIRRIYVNILKFNSKEELVYVYIKVHNQIPYRKMVECMRVSVIDLFDQYFRHA